MGHGTKSVILSKFNIIQACLANSANAKHLYNIYKTQAQRRRNVIQMCCVNTGNTFLACAWPRGHSAGGGAEMCLCKVTRVHPFATQAVTEAVGTENSRPRHPTCPVCHQSGLSSRLAIIPVFVHTHCDVSPVIHTHL